MVSLITSDPLLPSSAHKSCAMVGGFSLLKKVAIESVHVPHMRDMGYTYISALT